MESSISPRKSVKRFLLPKLSLRISERRVLLLTVDAILLEVGVVVALWLWALRSPPQPFTIDYLSAHALWFPGLVALWLGLGLVNDFYDIRVAAHFGDSSRALLRMAGLTLLLYILIYFFLPPRTLPRTFFLIHVVLAVGLLMLWRRSYAALFSLPPFQRRALIVGSGWAGRTIARTIQQHLNNDYQLVGYIDDDPAKQGQQIAGLPVLGVGQDLPHVVQAERVTEIILAITHEMSGQLFQTIQDCQESGVQVVAMSLLYEQVLERVPVEHLGQEWFIASRDGFGGFLYRRLKRAVDVIAALVGLAFMVVIMPLVAVAIYLDSPGPIFYLQERAGKGGQLFRLMKFRSMVPDAEADGMPRWASEDDQRVTRVGRFLRRTRLDELPQVLNILRGEMSFIGPRPERPEFIAQLEAQIPFYRTRLVVKPGLTGWAQVRYPYGNSVEDALVKLQYDLYYIKHQSLYLDLLILLKTIGVVLKFEGT